MRRLARERRVFFVEAPEVTEGETAIAVTTVEQGIHVVSLRLPAAWDGREVAAAQRRCVGGFINDLVRPMLWFYAPEMWAIARCLAPALVVYDCVGEAATRRGASAEARAHEVELLVRADVVFTAGTSLFEAKRAHNDSTYPLPSSVDAHHFDVRPHDRRFDVPQDLARIPPQRVAVVGPIDARTDLELLDRVATDRPNAHVVLVGPLVGLRREDLPARENLHWLGAKTYAELPRYIAACDVALIPYRLDPETRRTEASGFLPCLAARKPIVATPIDELVPFVERGLVRAVPPSRIVGALDAALREASDPACVRAREAGVSAALARTSWDRTCAAMIRLVDEARVTRRLAERHIDGAAPLSA